MKRVLLLLVVVSAFYSCTKAGPGNAGIFGKYELRGSYGGFMYFHQSFPAGNGNTFQFKSDSTYVHYRADTIASSGRFHINIKGMENGARYGTITFDAPVYLDNFRMKSDTVSIGTTAADGIVSDYVKLK